MLQAFVAQRPSGRFSGVFKATAWLGLGTPGSEIIHGSYYTAAANAAKAP